jgi:hypothetical protein
MNYRRVEASREVRLWVTQVIMPLAAITLLVPEVRHAVVNGAKKVKDKVQLKLHK